jgi:hypothetical protein
LHRSDSYYDDPAATNSISGMGTRSKAAKSIGQDGDDHGGVSQAMIHFYDFDKRVIQRFLCRPRGWQTADQWHEEYDEDDDDDNDDESNGASALGDVESGAGMRRNGNAAKKQKKRASVAQYSTRFNDPRLSTKLHAGARGIVCFDDPGQGQGMKVSTSGGLSQLTPGLLANSDGGGGYAPPQTSNSKRAGSILKANTAPQASRKSKLQSKRVSFHVSDLATADKGVTVQLASSSVAETSANNDGGDDVDGAH